jgi:hypothetical protein
VALARTWRIVAALTPILALLVVHGDVAQGATPMSARTMVTLSAVYSCASTRAESARPGATVVSTARFGPYRATLSGRIAPGGFVARPSLSLADNGKTVATYQLFADEPLTNFSTIEELSGSWTGVTSGSGRDSDLCLARFSADQPPADAFQAGDQPRVVAIVPVNDPPGANQCCEIVNMFDIEGGTGYAFANAIGAVNLGPEAPADLVPERGTALLITVNSAFFLEFTDEVDTASPVKVLEVGPYGVEDVTRSWPSYVTTDADMWLKLLERPGEERSPRTARGLLAAWAADECELGHGQAALSRVAQVAAGEVAEPGWPSAPSFVASLRSFLAAQGYDWPGQ